MKKIIFILSFLSFTMVLFVTCKKSPEIEDNSNKVNIPVVETGEPENITINYATINSQITSDGNGSVLSRGVCWNQNGNPSLENNDGFTTEGSGTGNYTSAIYNLLDKTNYYVTAYATNVAGVAYGNKETFTTLEILLPDISTATPSFITSTSAICGGNVLNNGNTEIIARGVCWNNTGNPTLQNNLNYSTEEGELGEFTSTLTNLEDYTTYYVAAYATNMRGTIYGDQVSFKNEFQFGEACPDIPSVNYDGQTYQTVLIGEQCWMAENLNFETNNSFCYNDNSESCDLYGRLYTLDAAIQACPDGWHLPSDNEWMTLEITLGITNEAFAIG